MSWKWQVSQSAVRNSDRNFNPKCSFPASYQTASGGVYKEFKNL